MNLQEYAHRRYNPLSDEWVLVSPHRTQRPWQGKQEAASGSLPPEYDPKCYLCPGNNRAGGAVNPPYEGTYVFVNDFSALLPDVPSGRFDENGLVVASSERGICKVLCFSPRHDLTLARMETDAIIHVVEAWVDQYSKIGSEPFINYVQIFENRGEMMGASNPHPHGQIWANENVPNLPRKETIQQGAYRERTGGCLLCNYLSYELNSNERIVIEGSDFVVLVPFWATWPFEVMVVPKRHITSIPELSKTERQSLADIIRRISIRYDNLFETSFPYSMGMHQRPTDGEAHDEWHLHLHYYPPLLRSATVRKFMVGYELLGMPQRDITAEGAADRLRSLSETHYSKGQV